MRTLLLAVLLTTSAFADDGATSAGTTSSGTPSSGTTSSEATSPEPADAIADATLPPPGPPPPADQVDALTNRVASSLRCPVCQGLSVADSPSETARAMKDRVRELVVQGYTDDQIRDWFVARYGEWVLLEPPFYDNWLVWLGPGLAFGVGLALVATVVARWRKEPDHAPLPSDLGLVPKDEYEKRLLEELEK